MRASECQLALDDGDLPPNFRAPPSGLLQVYGLPALILIKDGKLVPGSKREGAISKALLLEWLKKNGVPAPA